MAETNFASDVSTQALRASATTLASVAVGSGPSGTPVTHIISSLKSISFGEVGAFDSVSTTVTLAGVVAGATIVVNPTSKWSAAYYDISIGAVASAASTVLVSAVNSTATAITPDNMNFRVTAFNF